MSEPTIEERLDALERWAHPPAALPIADHEARIARLEAREAERANPMTGAVAADHNRLSMEIHPDDLPFGNRARCNEWRHFSDRTYQCTLTYGHGHSARHSPHKAIMADGTWLLWPG